MVQKPPMLLQKHHLIRFETKKISSWCAKYFLKLKDHPVTYYKIQGLKQPISLQQILTGVLFFQCTQKCNLKLFHKAPLISELAKNPTYFQNVTYTPLSPFSLAS